MLHRVAQRHVPASVNDTPHALERVRARACLRVVAVLVRNHQVRNRRAVVGQGLRQADGARRRVRVAAGVLVQGRVVRAHVPRRHRVENRHVLHRVAQRHVPAKVNHTPHALERVRARTRSRVVAVLVRNLQVRRGRAVVAQRRRHPDGARRRVRVAGGILVECRVARAVIRRKFRVRHREAHRVASLAALGVRHLHRRRVLVAAVVGKRPRHRRVVRVRVRGVSTPPVVVAADVAARRRRAHRVRQRVRAQVRRTRCRHRQRVRLRHHERRRVRVGQEVRHRHQVPARLQARQADGAVAAPRGRHGAVNNVGVRRCPGLAARHRQFGTAVAVAAARHRRHRRHRQYQRVVYDQAAVRNREQHRVVVRVRVLERRLGQTHRVGARQRLRLHRVAREQEVRHLVQVQRVRDDHFVAAHRVGLAVVVVLRRAARDRHRHVPVRRDAQRARRHGRRERVLVRHVQRVRRRRRQQVCLHRAVQGLVPVHPVGVYLVRRRAVFGPAAPGLRYQRVARRENARSVRVVRARQRGAVVGLARAAARDHDLRRVLPYRQAAVRHLEHHARKVAVPVREVRGDEAHRVRARVAARGHRVRRRSRVPHAVRAVQRAADRDHLVARHTVLVAVVCQSVRVPTDLHLNTRKRVHRQRAVRHPEHHVVEVAAQVMEVGVLQAHRVRARVRAAGRRVLGRARVLKVGLRVQAVADRAHRVARHRVLRPVVRRRARVPDDLHLHRRRHRRDLHVAVVHREQHHREVPVRVAEVARLKAHVCRARVRARRQRRRVASHVRGVVHSRAAHRQHVPARHHVLRARIYQGHPPAHHRHAHRVSHRRDTLPAVRHRERHRAEVRVRVPETVRRQVHVRRAAVRPRRVRRARERVVR